MARRHMSILYDKKNYWHFIDIAINMHAVYLSLSAPFVIAERTRRWGGREGEGGGGGGGREGRGGEWERDGVCVCVWGGCFS